MTLSILYASASMDVAGRAVAQQKARREAHRLYRNFARANIRLGQLVKNYLDAFKRPKIDKGWPAFHHVDSHVNKELSEMIGIVRALHNRIGESVDITTQAYYRTACAQTRGFVTQHLTRAGYFGANDATFKILVGSYRFSPIPKMGGVDIDPPMRQHHGGHTPPKRFLQATA
jgi:hypothetical protein